MIKYTEKNNFLITDFEKPSSEYSPIYSWIWNSSMNRATIQKEIDEMVEMGIRAFYIIPEPPEFRLGYMETKMSPPYLSEKFFSLVRYAIEYASEKDMITWMYDEGGWPSGSACGKVTEKYPEVRAKRIAVKNFNLKAGQTLKWEVEFISAVCGDKIWENEDIEACADMNIELYYIHTLKTRDPHLACKKAVDEFIQSTYDEYKKYMGDLFGKKAFAMFTDEAILYAPFYVGGIGEFEEKYGWHFAKMVSALFSDRYGKEGKRFKAEYIEFCCEKFCKTYIDALHGWCRKNNILFTGHMNGDDVLSGYIYQAGNALYHLRHMDIPGVDVIWRQIYPGSEKNNFFPRIASSAAHQIGSTHSVSESFAVYGTGMTYDVMRYVCGYQFVRGITIINPMSITSGRKEFLSNQCRPHFVPELPGAKHMKYFNEYLSRMMYLASVGKIDAEAALYMPIRDVWADNYEAEQKFYEFGRKLEEKQIYFDVIDDNYICESDISAKGMGIAKYKKVFVPQNSWMKKETKEKLRKFVQAGGRVFEYAHTNMDFSEKWTENDEVEYSPVRCSNINIRAMHRICENGHIYIFFNESAGCEYFDIELNTKHKKLYRLNPENGKTYLFRNSKCYLPSGGEIVVFATDSDLKCCSEAEKGELISIAKIISLKKAESHLFEGGAWKILKENSEMKNCEWENNFSGTAVYTAEFKANFGDNIVIDCGHIYGSCRLKLNGYNLGVRTMSPFEFEAKGSIIKDKNLIELFVSNTGANAMCNTDFSEYPSEIKGPYHKKTLEFESESVKSGLDGEIKIFKALIQCADS